MFGVLKIGKLGASMKRAGFNPRTLFAASEPGAWYDPADLSTLFQDSAFTVPVTAVEQPVGGILDLSGRGNHAFQATNTKRPIYSRRVNLCMNTTTPAIWARVGGTSSVGSQDAAGGWEVTATGPQALALISLGTSGGFDGYPIGAEDPGAFVIVRSLEIKKGTARYIIIGSGGGGPVLDLDTNTIVSGAAGFAKITIEALDEGYVRLTTYFEYNNNGASALSFYSAWGTGYSGVSISTTGQVGTTAFIRNPSFVVLPTGSTKSVRFQAVTSPTDYDAGPAKFPAYLRFDGVDDALQTGNIDFTGTDKMTVVAGVSRIANGGVAIELSTAVASNAGSFYFFAGDRATAAGARWTISSRGSAVDNADQAVETAANYNAPLTNVVTGAFDISGDSTILRINGGQIGSATGVQGTGNYGNYPLYIGARSGTHLYFNGRLYSLIVRGAASDADQITTLENYANSKTGAY